MEKVGIPPPPPPHGDSIGQADNVSLQMCRLCVTPPYYPIKIISSFFSLKVIGKCGDPTKCPLNRHS